LSRDGIDGASDGAGVCASLRAIPANPNANDAHRLHAMKDRLFVVVVMLNSFRSEHVVVQDAKPHDCGQCSLQESIRAEATLVQVQAQILTQYQLLKKLQTYWRERC
jgi:hypothetical protein